MIRYYIDALLLCLATVSVVPFPQLQPPNSTMCQKMIMCYYDHVHNRAPPCTSLEGIDKLNKLASCHMAGSLKQLQDMQQARLKKIIECVQRRMIRHKEIEVEDPFYYPLPRNTFRCPYPRLGKKAKCELEQHDLTNEINKLTLKLRLRARQCASMMYDGGKGLSISGYSQEKALHNLRMEEHKAWNLDDVDFNHLDNPLYNKHDSLLGLRRMHVRSLGAGARVTRGCGGCKNANYAQKMQLNSGSGQLPQVLNEKQSIRSAEPFRGSFRKNTAQLGGGQFYHDDVAGGHSYGRTRVGVGGKFQNTALHSDKSQLLVAENARSRLNDLKAKSHSKVSDSGVDAYGRSSAISVNKPSCGSGCSL
ncbi:unnamed protein product [Soboliphyme baturini]|uniref:Clip domain-containing protein n=1 Tax=Soboliphyme baturini TaxID=241478 RepID=A0A183IGL0_9BILA|nr:unnamed protein product [Soboliphyme baturini]